MSNPQPTQDQAPVNTPQVRAHLDFVCRVDGPPGLLVQGWSATTDTPRAVLNTARGGEALTAAWVLRFPRADVSRYLGRSDDEAFAFFAFFPLQQRSAELRSLSLLADDGEPPSMATLAVADQLSDSARANLRALWPQLETQATQRFPNGLPLLLLDALSDAADSVDDAVHLHIDHASDLGDGLLIVDGWCVQQQGGVRIVLGEYCSGECVDIGARWTVVERPDALETVYKLGHHAADVGFVVHVDLRQAQLGNAAARRSSRHRYALFLLCADGRIGRTALTVERVYQFDGVVRAALGSFRSRDTHALRILDEQAGPALCLAYPQIEQPLRVRHDVQLGQALATPVVSVVVPVFGSLEMLQIQLARLAMDPAIHADAELIYVIDDPGLCEEAALLATELHEIYGLPLRVLGLGASVGYARAVEFGVAQARAEQVLLMDCDCLPMVSGWLRALSGMLQADAQLGAIGPQLLREDGSIDSAGLALAAHRRVPGLQRVVALGRGQPATGAHAEEPLQSVSAVSGACLLTRRALFATVGRFAGQYLLGHHEDYLYCARLRALNLRVALAPTAALVHIGGHARRERLLRQDWLQDTEWRAKIELYNQWRHARERAELEHPPQ